MERDLLASEIVYLNAENVWEDSLCSAAIVDRAGSFDQLNKIRKSTQEIILKCIPHLKFKNDRVYIGNSKKMATKISMALADLSDEQADGFRSELEKLVMDIKKLNKKITS